MINLGPADLTILFESHLEEHELFYVFNVILSHVT